MSDEERIMKLFINVHGKITGKCSMEILYNEEDEVDAVAVVKSGVVCWKVSKVDLLFDYITNKMVG